MEKITEGTEKGIAEQAFDAASKESTELLEYLIAKNVNSETAYRALLMAAACTAVAGSKTLEHTVEGLVIFYSMALRSTLEMLTEGTQTPA